MRFSSCLLLCVLTTVGVVGCQNAPREPNEPIVEAEADRSSKAPADATAFGGHHYKVYEENVSWHEAKKRCEKLGGHLATVGDEKEHTFIAKLADERFLFLGATDEKEEGKWVWVDGTEWDFTAWLGGQPNNSYGSEHYLSTFEGGGWNDAAVEGDDWWSPSGYICEWSD
jgi:hypothetical protein